MKRRTAAIFVGLALLAIPATSLGGDGDSRESASTYAGKGRLVAKDSAKRRPAAAVARVTSKKTSGVSYQVTSKPGNLPVDWSFTARCMKGGLIDYYPGPGDHKTKREPTKIQGRFRVPMNDPDLCTFAVAGQIYKNKTGKSVTVKIFKR